jgi:hypothetical protein
MVVVEARTASFAVPEQRMTGRCKSSRLPASVTTRGRMRRHSHLSWTCAPTLAAFSLLLPPLTSDAREVVHLQAIPKAITSEAVAERARCFTELADHQAAGELAAELQALARSWLAQ